MSEFNRMTVVAAAEIIEGMKTQAAFTSLALQWGVEDRCRSGSVQSKVNAMAHVAINENPTVHTLNGLQPLERAMIELATGADENVRRGKHGAWLRLVAGLRFDGFELVEKQVTDPNGRESLFGGDRLVTALELTRMLPADVSGLNFREAESEIVQLLDGHGFGVAKGHLSQAMSAFQRGEWSSANGELRNFYESYLNEMAVGLGYTGSDDSKAKRDFLGGLQPPFLLSDYNEWHSNNQKPQFVQGLMNRMHPHGGHPGLSEEEDAAFRLQISLVTARLFLRRYNQRKSI
ncbi:hypothetical protein [Ruegeria lacuscaerulensis]|uniref:hypothetical protein n=1 Tax=Ruegeria lacuscaerulensis TaxID=55218 RepID=UPI001479A067|nr:hypothetical protein [Ruegeria lacuscaerulensis]